MDRALWQVALELGVKAVFTFKTALIGHTNVIAPLDETECSLIVPYCSDICTANHDTQIDLIAFYRCAEPTPHTGPRAHLSSHIRAGFLLPTSCTERLSLARLAMSLVETMRSTSHFPL